MWHVLGRRVSTLVFSLGNLREREKLKDLGVDGRIILKCIL
jgi:hypothetical protein